MKGRTLTDTHITKLSEYGWQNIAHNLCRCVRFEAGEMIMQQGQPAANLAIVVSGQAKVCTTAPNGKNLVLCYYVADGLLGDLEFIAGHDTVTANVIAITEVECIVISCQQEKEKLRANVDFLNKLAAELAKKLIRCSDNYTTAALCSGEERLCAYILQVSPDDIFRDVLSDTSCSVGMSYRHMFRILGTLCEEGILKKQENGYRILDRERLQHKTTGIR